MKINKLEIEEGNKIYEINNKTAENFFRELEKVLENGNPIGIIEKIKTIMNHLENIKTKI
jgi:hypothetical protein